MKPTFYDNRLSIKLLSTNRSLDNEVKVGQMTSYKYEAIYFDISLEWIWWYI